MRVAPKIIVNDEDRQTLDRWARGRSTPARLVLQARIVLLAAEGQENKDIAEDLGTDRLLVGRWRKRFAEKGLAGIEKDAPRGGRKPKARAAIAATIIEWTTRKKPPNATPCSTRTLATPRGTRRSMVRRAGRANGLMPPLCRTFKVSNDPRFIEKVLDVVGLDLNPPEHALVLCVDEKTPIQALDRTPPTLPLKKGRCGTMTHDYVRNGTTPLLATLNVAEGQRIGTCMDRHRHPPWITFLKQIDEPTPAELHLHLMVDHDATHQHPWVQRGLKRHGRCHRHFIPTSRSSLNRVQRWFREITEKRIRRGVFRSVPELIKAIMAYIAGHNENPRGFV